MSLSAVSVVENKADITPSSMYRISDAVYMYQPRLSESALPDPSAPALVILLGWVAARDGPLAKYVEGYQRIYRRSVILLLKTHVIDMLLPSAAKAKVRSSIPAIRASIGTVSRDRQRNDCELLTHAFSNGGSRLLSALYDEYEIDASRRKLSTDEGILPKHVTVIDSAPTVRFDRLTVVASILQSIPSGLGRTLLTPIIHLVGFVWLLYAHMPGARDGMAIWAASHNDKTKVHEFRRTYIYSDTDPLIKRAWVEQHADAAEKEGFTVRRELFSNSPHVAHARTDPRRYWKIIQETWTG